MGCCNHAPGCCPLLGSNHCLCVAATTLRRQVRAQVPRCLPPLRDWHPVLLRAHNNLVGWAQEVDTCLCGDIPSNEHHRVRIVDFLYHRMVSILSWHVPHQHRSRHRCQPSWWSPECLALRVARNGAWRDFRRSRSPETYSRFRVARMPFHRTVRGCQRTFWVDWQERLASLSRSCPRVASMVRRTFSSPSRVDHASRVLWVPPSDIPVAADVSATNWRQHFSSVGAPPPPSASMTSSLRKSRRDFTSSILNQSSLVCLLHLSLRPSCVLLWPFVLVLLWVTTDCHTLCSKRISLGGNQQSSTSSVSSSLGEWSPLRGSAALWYLSSSVGTRPCPPTFAPFLSPVVASKSSSTWSMRELAPTSLPNSTNVKGFSLGCGLSGWVSRRPSHITVLFAHFCGFHRHSQSL